MSLTIANPPTLTGNDSWEEHIAKDIRTSGWVCITDLVRHINNETVTAFAGTKFKDSYFFYHDALTQMTCKRARTWMDKEGILKHWLLPVGECNAKTVYFGRPVGNSPEIMPWDCSLNQDVHSCVEKYSSICRWIPKGHPLYAQRFSKAS